MGAYDVLDPSQQAYVDVAIYNSIMVSTLGSDERWNASDASDIVTAFKGLRNEYAEHAEGKAVNESGFDISNQSTRAIDAIIDSPALLAMYSEDKSYGPAEVRKTVSGLHRNSDRLATIPKDPAALDPAAYSRLTPEERDNVNMRLVTDLLNGSLGDVDSMSEEERTAAVELRKMEYASPIAWGFKYDAEIPVSKPRTLTEVDSSTAYRAAHILIENPAMVFQSCEGDRLDITHAIELAKTLASNTTDMNTNGCLYRGEADAVFDVKHTPVCKEDSPERCRDA